MASLVAKGIKKGVEVSTNVLNGEPLGSKPRPPISFSSSCDPNYYPDDIAREQYRRNQKDMYKDPDEYDEDEAWGDVMKAREKSGTETGQPMYRNQMMMNNNGNSSGGPNNFEFNFDNYN